MFTDPSNFEENRLRQQLRERIDHWWQTLAQNTTALDDLFHNRSKWDLPAWMKQNLGAIDADLCWEFGADPVGHRLVITPERNRHLRPLARAILAAAPQTAGWAFYGYRQPESVEWAKATVQGRCRRKLDDATTVRLRAGKFNSVDVTFVSPDCRRPEDREALSAAFVAMESLVGEEVLDKWVGLINVSPPVLGERTIPLERLRPMVDVVIEQIREQLPNSACWQWPSETEWSLFKTPLYDAPRSKSDTVPEFPGRSDLLVGRTMYTPMWQFAHGPWPFFSERFSSWGETFCYLKIDGVNGLAGSSFGDRGDIEEALDRALKQAEVGCVTGGGTGLRYSYVDLALVDLKAGLALAREVLQDGRAPLRSWFLFFDAELQVEWLGVYDDTPAPPLEV
jgi:hypothetical protein